MIGYCILGSTAILTNRAPYRPQKGRVTFSLPAGVALYLNGRAYAAPGGIVKLSADVLRTVNHVRIRHTGGFCEAEGFLWDGESLTPAGYDTEAVLLAAATSLTAAHDRIAALEATVARLVGEVEATLFE